MVMVSSSRREQHVEVVSEKWAGRQQLAEGDRRQTCRSY